MLKGCLVLGVLLVAQCGGSLARGGVWWKRLRSADAWWCFLLQPLLNSTNLSPQELPNSTLYRGPVDPATWFGVHKGNPNLGYIQVGTGTPRPWRQGGRVLSDVSWA